MPRGGTSSFDAWFEKRSGYRPRTWQRALASDGVCADRLLRIPTGFGKTAGVVLAWMYHRVACRRDDWPRRLVYCLPMRTLVEQTAEAVRGWSRTLEDPVDVHVLMGGVEADPWALQPERDAVLVGTQDMLLSRALGRGYGAARGRWPMEFGLLHHDVLWVLDEVQLMDVGLATSAQLGAIRATGQRLRPAASWWMSATLQPAWLGTIDLRRDLEALAARTVSIAAEARHGDLWEVRKTLARIAAAGTEGELAALTRDRHQPATLTLVIVNTVERASAVFAELDALFSERRGKNRRRKADSPDLRLVHSRFRGHERKVWTQAFLSRGAVLPAEGRIVVATQVVEAGVDVSARTLITDLAPWSSIVQRFGRCARYAGQTGDVLVVGGVPRDEKLALPYRLDELEAAHRALASLDKEQGGASPRDVEAFEESLSEKDRARLYPYSPLHVLRRPDLEDLFDNSPDLTGADIDVSRFIRTGEENDVSVYWRPLDGSTRSIDRRSLPPPRREELCPVPVGRLRDFLKKKNVVGLVLDYIEGEWRPQTRLVPGMTVLLRASLGGYSAERGWDSSVDENVPAVPESSAELDALTATASDEDSDDLSEATWKTIATHGRETGEIAAWLADSLGLPEAHRRVLSLAGRWHDVGKGHRVFQDAILDRARRETALGARRDLAKAPQRAWRRPNPYPARPGFRHELASTLALFECVRRARPDSPWLAGAHRELLSALGAAPERPTGEPPPDALVEELVALEPEDLDLVAWLVCTHHGKVRCELVSTPRDQEAGHGGIHGVCDGDSFEKVRVVDASGAAHALPSLSLSLAIVAVGLSATYGASWSDRVQGLLARFGPFVLTFLEAVLRASDVRASLLETEDDLA